MYVPLFCEGGHMTIVYVLKLYTSLILINTEVQPDE